MKILYVNWAPLWRGAEVGGGVNLYSQSMATKLSELGHNLFSISAGFAYDFQKRSYIKRGPDFMGVKNYEIFNSPNIAPGFFNYENPIQDVSEPVVENLFKQFIEHIKPDVVHFQNIEGFSANCIEIAVKNGCRVIFSLHNYHPVCNQIYLLYKDKNICEDFDTGYKCLDCITPPAYSRELLKRRAAFHINRLPLGDRIWSRTQRIGGLRLTKNLIASFNAIFSINHNKQSEYNKLENNTLFLKKRSVLYAKRRKLIIESLNHAHMVHAVSDFVKDFYICQGVRADLVTTCHIGNKMAKMSCENIESTLKTKSRSVRSNTKNRDSSIPGKDINPLNIVFLGISSQPKGLPFLLKTLLWMANEKSASVKYSGILKHISLHIHARGVGSLSHLIEPLSAKLHSIETHDGYDFGKLPNILSGMSYGVVPPLWYDNAPQVVFEIMAMKIPVIGAKIGGIPDFVKDMHNGVLFRPGDKQDLAAKIEMLLNDRALESEFKKNIPPMKTPDQHACELECFYKGI